jgi:hypothetical protein
LRATRTAAKDRERLKKEAELIQAMQSDDPSYKKANTTTVSFGYFRTKDGNPPKTPEKK